MRLLIALLFVVFTAPAMALESSTELYNQAQIDAKSLQDVVLKLQQNISSMTSPKTFRDYFALLPRLKELSVKLNLEQIHPGGVEKLGESMVSYGTRWLDLAKDDLFIVKAHFVWMTPATALRYLHQIEDDVFLLKGEEFKNFATAVQYIIEVSGEKFTSDPYIEQGYRNLLSTLAYQKLKVTPITDVTEHQYWIPSIKNQDTLSSYTNLLQEYVLSYSKDNQDEATAIVNIVIALEDYLAKNTFPVADAVKSSSGYVVLELLDKSISQAWTLEEKSLTRLLDILNLAQLNSLADRMMSPSQSAGVKMYKQYIALAENLMARLKAMNAPLKAAELGAKAFSKIAPAMLLADDREGTYEIKAKNSKEKWRFTVFKSSEGRVIAGLGRVNGLGGNSTFFNVQYDVTTKTFRASENVIVDVGDYNFFVQFSFDQNGDVTVKSPLFPAEVGEALVGARVETYATYADVADSEATYIEGHFEGYTTLSGKKVPVKLYLGRFNENTIGRILIGDGVQLEIQEGTPGGEGYIYLTTGELKSGSALHFRFQQTEDDGLVGYSIMTGSGIRNDFHLNFIKQ